ncbi:hypothetical protein HDN1F_04850 [gamma proteobacterium HdN1]|nr:hypothetical protein HDN1F_04850 [gamma proteobacterium HdN1]
MSGEARYARWDDGSFGCESAKTNKKGVLMRIPSLFSVGFAAFLSSTPLVLADTVSDLSNQAADFFAEQAADSPAAPLDGEGVVVAAKPNLWLQNALQLQRHLDDREPLATSSFLMTHNSANAAAYRTVFSYIDPNQKLSLGQQLGAGIRSIELDVHQFFSMRGWPWQWKKRILLCHGQNNHLGCSPYDRVLSAGIDEVKDWLKKEENRQEVIVIYFEDHVDGNYAELVDAVAARLGDSIYRPTSGANCEGIPMQVSKQDILAAGKQVLLMGGSEVCRSSHGWNTWAFAGVGDRLNGYPTGDLAQVSDTNCQFDRSFYDRYWVRFYEDRTVISSLFAKPDRFGAEDVERLQKCGVNLIGFDRFSPTDARTRAYVWSWDEGQPAAISDAACALSQVNGRFSANACSEVARYACRVSGTHEWRITESAGTWQEGKFLCAHETGGEAVFVTPTNGYDNQSLQNAKAQAGAENVWIGLSQQDGAQAWQTNAGSAASESMTQ